eukprot:3481234-Ditylum_brightwellii.AAC.1
MAAAQLDVAHNIATTWHLCQQRVRNGVAASRTRVESTVWRQWAIFCLWLGISTNISTMADPIPIMQLFAKRVHSGVLVANSRPVKTDTVAGYLCAIGQIHASVGANDPRLDQEGNLDFCLTCQLAAYRKADPPSN